MSLAEKLVSLRKQKGLSQMELAEKLDVSRQAVSRWEVGTSVPSTDNLKVLSELYGVSVDYLLSTDANENYKNTKELEQKPIARVSFNKNKAILAGIIAALLVVGIATCLTVVQIQNQEVIIPIGEMDSAIDDCSSAISFSVG